MLVIFTACTTIDNHIAPSKDWPDLVTTEHVVSFPEMVNACMPYIMITSF